MGSNVTTNHGFPSPDELNDRNLKRVIIDQSSNELFIFDYTNQGWQLFKLKPSQDSITIDPMDTLNNFQMRSACTVFGLLCELGWYMVRR